MRLSDIPRMTADLVGNMLHSGNFDNPEPLAQEVGEDVTVTMSAIDPVYPLISDMMFHRHDGRDGSFTTEPFSARTDHCPLYSRKRTFGDGLPMSAKCQERTSRLSVRSSMPLI